MWWNEAWRYRATVVRPTPWRDEGPRPVEAAIDFSRLLEGGGVEGEFDPASVRIVVPRPAGDGDEVPFAYRSEYDPETREDRAYLAWMARPEKGVGGAYHIYFDTRDRGIAAAECDGASVPPENLIANPSFEDAANGFPAEWTASSPERVGLGRFAHTTGERSLKIVVDENTPEDAPREFTISQKVDVSEYAGREMVFECDLFAERASYGAPVSIELQQFRADGSRIPEWAVQPRWLTIDLAQGQLVQFRERGRFSAEAATVNVLVRFGCHVKDADTAETIPVGPDACFTLWMDRMVMRPGERWPWPAETRGGFVAGVTDDAPLNRAFQFTGQRRLFFNGASEGSLSSGTYNPNPRAIHWGPEAGTLEFWCRPSWGASDKARRIFFEGTVHATKVQSRLSKMWVRGKTLLKFLIVDSAGKEHELTGPASFQVGQWHHIAVTWNFPKAHLQIFFDGKRVGEQRPGSKPWPSSRVPVDKTMKPSGFGLMEDDVRSLPMQAYIGGDEDCLAKHSAEAALDEFRISDVSRYAEDFVPARKEFETDEATRVLFHFENERDGVHDSDDRFVEGHLVCELPRYEETAHLELRKPDGLEDRTVIVKPHPAPEAFEANRAPNRLPVDEHGKNLPDARFVEYRERKAERNVHGEEDAFNLDVGGDFEPLMRSITWERTEEAGEPTTLLPRWRANDNVLPFSIRDIAATLGANAKDDAERAFEVFRYALDTSYYFNADYCETLPTRHRLRSFWTFLKALNIYPLNQCGPLNFTLRKLFLAVGISCNNALGTHHQFQQTFYQGRWRLFDLAPRLYWLDRDSKTVAPWRTLQEDPYLLVRERNMFAIWMRGRPYEPMIGQPERPHDMAFPLRTGERMSVCWHNEGRWTELRREREPIPIAKIPPTFGNGALDFTPAGGSEAASLDNMTVEMVDGAVVLRATDPAKPASLIYRAQCPYIFSDASVTGAYTGRKAKLATLSISFDKGETWTKVWRNRGKTGEIAESLLDHVSARYEYWLKIDFVARSDARVTGLRVRTTFVVSTLSLPGRLSCGRNRITFAGGPSTVPLKTVCRWVERSKSDLGVSLNSLSYYLNADETHRNLFIVSPGIERALEVALLGREFKGEVALEGLPSEWVSGSDRQDVSVNADAEGAASAFHIQAPPCVEPGEIRAFDVVLREKGEERRVPAQVLVADAPLIREAESANEVTGEVAVVDVPEASGARVIQFFDPGTLRFDFSSSNDGEYALWLRAQWDDPKKKNRLTLALDGGRRRVLHRVSMIGFSDWASKREANAKKYMEYGERDAYWHRIPAVSLKAGDHTLTLGADEGATFDALVLLPQNARMDRAAMNLFQNWNFAPWQNPF